MTEAPRDVRDRLTYGPEGGMRKMTYPLRRDIPENQINNGALILLLLKECKTWTELCRRYHDANPTISFAALPQSNSMSNSRE